MIERDDLSNLFWDLCFERTTWADRNRLGVTPTAAALASIAVARIKPHRGRLFELDDSGEDALLLPVIDDGAEEFGELIDIVALHPHVPARWWRYRGEALALYNLGHVEDAATHDDPLRLHRSPLEWLRSGLPGLVILDWHHAMPLLCGFKRIASNDDGLIRYAQREIYRLATQDLPEFFSGGRKTAA